MPKNYRWLGHIILIALLALTASAAAAPFVCGDADSSGNVDISDAVYLITYIFAGGPEPVPLRAGDASGDQIVDISDAVHLITYIFAGGPDPICTYGTVTDYDGNVYWTIKIGDQWWMMENLKVTHYRNGDPIPQVTAEVTWSGLTTGAYCNYNNDEGYVATYGRLYNWYAVADIRNIAPAGWHVPTDAEWKQLEMYLGMSQAQADAADWRGADEGGKLKEAGTTHWNSPNTGATSENGFSALPGACRSSSGYFLDMGYNAAFWSSTETNSNGAWGRSLYYSGAQVSRNNHSKQSGFSVRCVRD